VRRHAAILACLLGCRHAEPVAPPPAPAAAPTGLAELAAEVCACTDLACTDYVQKAWIERNAKAHVAADKRAMAQLTDCMAALATAAAQAGPSAPRVAAVHVRDTSITGVAECDELIDAYERYLECDKFRAGNPSAVQAGHAAVDQMKQAWAQLKDAPQASKDAAASGCGQALDGMKQSQQVMGCP
jgi:hypothetical protein